MKSFTLRRSRVLRSLAVATACCIGLAPGAYAADTVNIFDGDGGLVQQTCSASSPQIRIDSSSFSTMSACFGLVKSTGWVAVSITGSYGVVNNLSVPAHVAFRLPDGAVYWQETVDPGQVKTLDVNHGGSTVVEIQVTPVAVSAGPATGTLDVSTADSPNYVSLRSAQASTSGRVARVSWSGMSTAALDRNSGFNHRLDATFKVVPALDSSSCVSFESAAYPGMYLTADTGSSLRVRPNPAASRATFCPSSASSAVTATTLRVAADQSTAVGIGPRGELRLVSARSSSAAWFVDTGLARP